MLNNQQDWQEGGGLYDHLISTKTFALIKNKKIRTSFQITRKLATASLWIC